MCLFFVPRNISRYPDVSSPEAKIKCYSLVLASCQVLCSNMVVKHKTLILCSMNPEGNQITLTFSLVSQIN